MLLKFLKGSKSSEIWEQWVIFQLLLVGPEYLFNPVNLWVSVKAKLLKNSNPLGQFQPYMSLSSTVFRAFSFHSALQEKLSQDHHQILELELKLDWIWWKLVFHSPMAIEEVFKLSLCSAVQRFILPRGSWHRAKGQISAPFLFQT